MISEDYVSFETAKLLKEKGFGGECFSMYVTPKPHSRMGNPNEAKIAPHGRDSHYYEGYEYQCEAPTLQMAMKWLREVHNIHFFPDPTLTKEGRVVYGMYVLDTDLVGFLYENLEENTYEEACEAAIKYCLENLI